MLRTIPVVAVIRVSITVTSSREDDSILSYALIIDRTPGHNVAGIGPGRAGRLQQSSSRDSHLNKPIFKVRPDFPPSIVE